MSEAEKSQAYSNSLSDDTFIFAALLLDVAEKEGVAVARAEFDVAVARAKLRQVREGQSTISNTTR